MSKQTVPGYQRFEFRTGLANLKWRGMRSSGDAATNLPNQVRVAVNARFRGGNIVCRDGWAKVKASTLPQGQSQGGQCIDGMFDQTGSVARLWAIVNGCHNGLGGTIFSFSQDQSPDVQAFGIYLDSVNKPLYLAQFAGDIYVGDLGRIRKLKIFQQPYGLSAQALAGITDTVVKDFTIGATATLVSAMMNYIQGALLLVGLNNGASSSIWSYDGLTWRLDKSVASAPLAMCAWRENAVIGFNGSIQIRDNTGAYTTVSNGALTVYQSQNSMVSWQDKVWICDGATHLWSYDGTTLAIAHSPAGATSVVSVAVYGGLLYVAYNTATDARIAKFDGTTWIDVEKNITTQFSNDKIILSLLPFRGALFAGMGGTKFVSPDFLGQMFACPGYNTQGPWIGTGSLSPPAANPGVIGLLVA